MSNSTSEVPTESFFHKEVFTYIIAAVVVVILIVLIFYASYSVFKSRKKSSNLEINQASTQETNSSERTWAWVYQDEVGLENPHHGSGGVFRANFDTISGKISSEGEIADN